MEMRFTEKAQYCLALSKEKAKALTCDYIGTEHILLAILEEGNNVAANILERRGVTLGLIESGIRELLDETNSNPYEGEPKFTPRARKVLDKSFREAARYNSALVGTEHILLAILTEFDSYAVKCITELNVNINALINDVIMTIRTGVVSDESAEGSGEGPRTGLSDKNMPNLSKCARDLTQLAKEQKFDPIIGRDTEINRVMQVLCRRTKNNPCLIGEPGVGKTAIAEGLANDTKTRAVLISSAIILFSFFIHNSSTFLEILLYGNKTSYSAGNNTYGKESNKKVYHIIGKRYNCKAPAYHCKHLGNR